MAPQQELRGKTVVIAGGSRGIGLEWTRVLVARGNTVFATARDPGTAAGLAALAAQSPSLTVLALDVADADSIQGFAEELKRRVGHVDVLLNNAGVALEPFEHGLADMCAARLAETLSVNAAGPLLVTRALLQQGLLGGYAPSTVAYTSSIMASMAGYAFPKSRMYAYRASKAALNMLVLASVQELTQRNVTSVLLHPGYVATDMTAGHSGALISTAESVSGQLALLEDGRPLNGKFYSYDGEEVPF